MQMVKPWSTVNRWLSAMPYSALSVNKSSTSAATCPRRYGRYWGVGASSNTFCATCNLLRARSRRWRPRLPTAGDSKANGSTRKWNVGKLSQHQATTRTTAMSMIVPLLLIPLRIRSRRPSPRKPNAWRFQPRRRILCGPDQPRPCRAVPSLQRIPRRLLSLRPRRKPRL